MDTAMCYGGEFVEYRFDEDGCRLKTVENQERTMEN